MSGTQFTSPLVCVEGMSENRLVVTSKKTDEEANERWLAYELQSLYESAATAAATYMTMPTSCQAFFGAERSADLRLSIFAFH
jgi:hypothetical protein